MALAERIGAALGRHELVSGDYRGRGFTRRGGAARFLNIRLDPAVWHAQLRAILQAGTAYGDSTIGGGEKVNIEFVSANPTGPMHVGHGRGAVVGDALAALLAKAGFAVHREYYINDAGAQVDALARSAHLRYREALGEDDRRDPRRALSRRIPDRRPARRSPSTTIAKWLGRPEAEWLAPAARLRRRRDDAADPGRPRGARRRLRRLRCRSASWSRAARSMPRSPRSSERGLIYDGRAGAAQGQAAR